HYHDGEACGQSGNLVGLCDLLKDGASCDGRPRGQRFKDIVQDLQAIAGGTPAAAITAARSTLVVCTFSNSSSDIYGV
ncbi:MAG: hypothetical protein IIA44_13335, partial [Acidobacteria bacterium]|nr:hypothetical protein [Acidobacteriota bacterium]